MEELLLNIKTFWKSAELINNSGDYTSATTLYFKCLFVLLDLIILKNKKITPKDHTDRFRILQRDFPVLYSTLDRIFPIYRDTYSLQVENDKCTEVKNRVLQISKEQGILLND
jgi:uncharacterized protein (UPF0332 family)